MYWYNIKTNINNYGKYKGKSNKLIASKDYILYYEKMCFYRNLSSQLSSGYQYKDNILKYLSVVSGSITEDLRKIMPPEKRKLLVNAAKSIQQCGVKVNIPKDPMEGKKADERVVIGTYTFSPKELNHLAEQFDEEQEEEYQNYIAYGNGIVSIIINEAISPYISRVISYSASILGSKLSTYYTKKEKDRINGKIQEAIQKRKKLKIIITDYKYHPTSYSLEITYELVD